MKTVLITTVATAALFVLPMSATAGGGYSSGVLNAGQDAWAQEAFYDACMNGAVSANGLFSSQTAEDKAVLRMSIAGGNES